MVLQTSLSHHLTARSVISQSNGTRSARWVPRERRAIKAIPALLAEVGSDLRNPGGFRRHRPGGGAHRTAEPGDVAGGARANLFPLHPGPADLEARPKELRRRIGVGGLPSSGSDSVPKLIRNRPVCILTLHFQISRLMRMDPIPTAARIDSHCQGGCHAA